MSTRIEFRLNFAKKVALMTAAAAALAVPVAVAILNAPAIRAQSTSTDPSATPKLEVASVKPCKVEDADGGGRGKKGGAGGRTRWSPGRLSEECPSLDYVIREAYLRFGSGKPWPIAKHGEDPGIGNLIASGLPPISDRLFREPIKGSPAWIISDHYTIDVKAEGPATQEMMRGPMMQALLEDRFKLKIHRESREVPVYELTVAKGGPKLQPFKEGSCIARLGPDFREPGPGQPWPHLCGMFNSGKNGTDVPGTTMGNLCRQLSNLFDRDVIDKTGIAGMFDIHLDTHPSEIQADDPPLPSGAPRTLGSAVGMELIAQLANALPKIGLKIEPAKGTGAFLVIDHVERPTGN